MANYLINYTDPGKTPIQLSPYTSNGPDSPSSTTPLYGTSIVADTSLVLLGKGFTDYGERLQEDMLHLLEHFAFPTEPAYPIEGQIWYKNSAQQLWVCVDPLGATVADRWSEIVIANPDGNLDMGAYRIVNLGNPVNAQDAVTLSYADTRYVNVAGDTITGNITMTTGDLVLGSGDITLTSGNLNILAGNVTLQAGTMIVPTGSDITISDAPVNGVDVTNKAYVDGEISTAVAALGAVYVDVAGDTMTGPLVMSSTDITINSGTLNMVGSTIDMGVTNRIINLADPVNPQDAATRAYVLANAGGGGGGVADGVVTSGSINTATDQLTLNRSIGAPVVIANIAAGDHIQPTTRVTNSLTVYASSEDAFLQTTLVEDVNFPDVLLSTVIETLDAKVGRLGRRADRSMRQGDGVQTTFTTPFYLTEDHTLHVSVNGIQQYASQRAAFLVQVTQDANPIWLHTDLSTLTPAAVLTFDITVDGTLYAGVSVTVPAGPVIIVNDIYVLMKAALVTAGVPATVVFERGVFLFQSNTTGNTSQVWVEDVDLFSTIAANVPPIPGNGAFAGAVKDVNLVAITGADTVNDEFTIAGDYTAAFQTGTTFTVFESTLNDGPYTVIAPGATYGGGNTTIPVTLVPDATVNGDIYFCRTLSYSEPGNPGSEQETIIFQNAPAAGSLIEFTTI
jgi:hypothetical protein